MDSTRWGRAHGPTQPLAAGSLATCSLLPRVHGPTSRRWGRPRLVYRSSTSARVGGCSNISAPASPLNSRLVGIGNGMLDHVKRVENHEGQKVHALHQKGMLTLDNLMAEPHLKRVWCSKPCAANSKVIMLGKEWEPPPYKLVVSLLARQRKRQRTSASWSRFAPPIHRLLPFGCKPGTGASTRRILGIPRGNGRGRLHHGGASLPDP